MKVVAIIQARMGSSRLPGKVLREVMDKPLLYYQLARVRKSNYLDEIIVATTTLANDDCIVDLCMSQNIKVYRGSEQDVLTRYVEATKEANADIIVRLTADCPLLDPVLIDQLIEVFKREQDVDYVSNVINRTYPRGLDIEVFSQEALIKVNQWATSTSYREHVTNYLLEHPEKFRLRNVSNPTDISFHRWTVDTIEDFQLIQHILIALYSGDPYFSFNDVLRLLDDHPEWYQINVDVKQKDW
ncbi:spore coat polysaccharide biosynthesis protein spsF [Gracilibacillus boraciitolerans JCM 21714]|uniref:Spore coat polysaccharide biosynthesis protein spsF n=1 Tax=Gracilibacillus boraciitolerans JCM 21714 TaxID=1298598 RepID=W4VIN4_9BACI|nr:glycosyltransferase family protein [Gracilibacillus boraciitolerans]GAE92678.1 spore coat polysaccharide biosynthesis protein spsF [Gracilibacillus boraciitolerans JCM 21714]